ncbi:MAG: helicase-associated domain-containing protein [Ktedonobacteraceae bacterium]
MANVSATLRRTFLEYSEEELARIANTWVVGEVPADGWQENVSQLGEKMQEMISARFACESLSSNAREILHQVILFEMMDGVPFTDLQALTGLTEGDFAAALAECKQRLMLVEERPNAKVKTRMETRGQKDSRVLVMPKEFRDVLITVDREMYNPLGDRSRWKLVDVLAKYEPAQLQAMMVLHNSGSFGSTYYSDSAGLAKSVAGKLVQVTAIEIAWEKFDPVTQKLCRWLCKTDDGIAELTQVRTALGLSNPVLATCLRLLGKYGFVFDTFSGQERKIFIGRGILKVLRKAIGEADKEAELQQRATKLAVLQDEPPVVHEAHGLLLYDLAVVVGATYQQIIEPTQAGKVPKRLANKIAPLLHSHRKSSYYENDDYYLDIVFYIAQHLEILQLKEHTGQKARYVPGPKLAAWSHMQPYEQARLLLDVWWSPQNDFWSDMAGVNYRPDGFSYYLDMRAARKTLLEYLAQECRPGQWYTLESFLQTIKERDPLLLRAQSRHSSYSNAGHIRKTIIANWEQGDSQIIAGMLTSSLYEMGIVTPGYQADVSLKEEQKSNAYAFKLTELAAAVFGPIQSGESAAAQTQRTLIVQPNFELLLLQPDFTTLYQLLPFAKVDQVEMVSRLTLTQESVRRGVEAGWGVERSLQTLRDRSQKDLPQNVLYTMQDWSKFYKDATVSQVLLLEVSSESVADEICASAKFRTLELRRLGPCAVLVGGQVSLQVLRNTLEKEGVILRVQGDILTVRETAAASSSTYYGRSR